MLSLGYLIRHLSGEDTLHPTISLVVVLFFWLMKFYMAYLLITRWSRLPKANRSSMIAFILIA
jgi:hypothetical protein